jgi:hypothetical protein
MASRYSAGFFGGVEGCSLFVGYDSAMKTPKHATILTAKPENISEGATSKTFDISVCTSATEVAQSLRITAATNVNGFYGGVTAKMNLMQSMKISTYATTVVVYANIEIGPQTTSDVALKTDVSLPDWSTATSAELEQFVRSYEILSFPV